MIEALVEEYQSIDELFWKVKLPDLPPVIVDSDSKQGIKNGLRKTLKPDSFKEISIERVTKTEKRKMHLALAKGMEDEEPVEEDAKMGKQSDDQLRKLYKKASAMDQSSPANKSFTQRIGKEMKKRGISEDAPTQSVSSGAVAMPPDVQMWRRKRYKEFAVSDDVYHKFRNGKMKFERWSKYLNLENEGERAIYDYAKRNHRGICVLRHEDTGQVRAIRYSRTGGGNWGSIQRVREQVMRNTERFTALDEDVLDILRNIVKNKQMQRVKFQDKKTASVDGFTASAMVQVYDAINKDNQSKFREMINKNLKGFMAMQSFAMKSVK